MPDDHHDPHTDRTAVVHAIGIDRAAGAWVGLRIAATSPSTIRIVGAHRCVDLRDLLAALGPADAYGIDCPVGLTRTGSRRCDQTLRHLLRPHGSRVFVMPPQAVVAHPGTHAEASALAVELTGGGISMQAYRLFPQVREVRAVVADGPPLIEVHPDTCFARWNDGVPLRASKRTWAGLRARTALLADIAIPDDLGTAGVAAPDDVVDALAVAVATSQHHLGAGSWLDEDRADAAPGPLPRVWLPAVRSPIAPRHDGARPSVEPEGSLAFTQDPEGEP